MSDLPFPLRHLLMKVYIGLFLLLTLLASAWFSWLEYSGGITLEASVAFLTFASLAELVVTLALWAYTAWYASLSREPLEMLNEMLSRVKPFWSVFSVIFEEVEKKFKWSLESRASFIKERISAYQDELVNLEVAMRERSGRRRWGRGRIAKEVRKEIEQARPPEAKP